MTLDEAQARAATAVADAALLWGEAQLVRLAALGFDPDEAQEMVAARMQAPSFRRWADDIQATLTRSFLVSDAAPGRLPSAGASVSMFRGANTDTSGGALSA